MKRFKEQNAYLVGLFILTVFIILPGCSGMFGGGSWNKPHPPVITAYSLGGVAGTVNDATKNIAVTMPYGTNPNGLVATYTTTGTGVKVGTVTQVSGTTPNNFTTPATYVVSGADNSTATYTVTVTVAPVYAKAITAYSLNGVAGIINETPKTIAVTMPFGTNPNGLVATFTTTGTGVLVGSTTQVSGTTAQNFTTPVTYTVTAADGSTATYTVTVIVAASSVKAIAPFTLNGIPGIINEAAKTIAVTMPFGTSLNGLIATFTSTGQGVPTVGGINQVSGTTANNFSSPVSYLVTAADGTTATYNVTVTVAANSAKCLAPYTLNGVPGIINETAKTIAVTMPFGTSRNSLIATFASTGQGVPTVNGANQISGTTANDFITPVSYVVTAADGTTATYVVTVTVAANSAKAIAPYTLNGVPGIINESLSPKTIGVTMPFGTNPNGLIATFTSTGQGVPTVAGTNQLSGVTPNNFTTPVSYLVTAADGSTATYVVTVTVAANAAKAIAPYSLNGIPGVINESVTPKTITVTMPTGTNPNGLVATFTSTGQGVPTVGGTNQLSGTTTNDFTTPVSYLVTAADASTATYVVTVTVAASSAKAIAPYSLNGVSGVINESLNPKTITVGMPVGTNANGLIATFTSTGQGVPTVGGTNQLSGITPNNFTAPVTYIVTAADGTTATYVVTVTVAVVDYGPAGPAPILGSASTYGIIANDAITNSGATLMHLYGDIALASSTSTALVGFTLGGTVSVPTSPRVTGQIVTTDLGNSALLPQLQTDLRATYTNNKLGSARVAPASAPSATGNGGTFAAGVIDLSGMVLRPGIYAVGTTTDTFGLSNVAGPLVLDAQGNPDAVFIFQADTLTTTTGSVVLQGGAQAKNVFWVLTNNATVGTNTFFQGTLVAGRTITINANTIVDGRMLAGADSSAPVGTGNLTVSGVVTVPE